MVKRPLQLIVDFDGTLTEMDTMHIVAKAGYDRQQTTNFSRAAKIPPWQYFVDAYMVEYKAYTANYSPGNLMRKAVPEEAAWLDGLHHVETKSADRVDDAGILNNMTTKDMETAASTALNSGQVNLRDGWADLLVAVYCFNSSGLRSQAASNAINLVSVNWSRWFVWSTVWTAAGMLKDHEFEAKIKEVLLKTSVYANEVESLLREYESRSKSLPPPGGNSMILRTAGDKLKLMRSKAFDMSGAPNPIRVYIGDSVTDFECLVMADVGICVRDHIMGSGQKELASTCERLGINVKCLEDFQGLSERVATIEALQEDHSRKPRTLYYAHDFKEVKQWLLTLMDPRF